MHKEKEFALRGRSDVASAPLELLPNYAEERRVGQRRQWERFLCFPDRDNGSALNVDRPPAIERKVNRIIGIARFDFDDRSIRNNDRSVGKHVRANRRYYENAGLRIENRSPSRQ